METPLLAADALVLYGDGIVLIRRENPPYQGFYALPGGFVEVGETVEEAVRREASAKRLLFMVFSSTFSTRSRGSTACG